jgi:hypothetical protein
MIIAFYPGAGGNRYLRSLQGFEWQTSNMSYDSFNRQHFANRYLLQEPIDVDQDFILTHCLNATHLQKKFPGHKITYIISDLKSSLKREWQLHGHQRFVDQTPVPVLDRLEHYNAFKDATWPVCNTIDDLYALPTNIINEVNDDFKKIKPTVVADILKELEIDIINKINSSYEIIKWHKDYYLTYPIEYSHDATVINVSNKSDDFSTFMSQEFNLYNNEIFDLVWSKLHG